MLRDSICERRLRGAVLRGALAAAALVVTSAVAPVAGAQPPPEGPADPQKDPDAEPAEGPADPPDAPPKEKKEEPKTPGPEKKGAVPPKVDPTPEIDRWRDLATLKFGPVSLRPLLLLQVQLAPYAGDESFFQNGDPHEQPGFRLRRARIGLRAEIEKRARAEVTAQLGQDPTGIAGLQSAYLGYTEFEFLQGFAGAMTVPFGRSATTDSGYIGLVERPLAVRALAPFQQVGAILGGSVADRRFSYQAGVFNAFERRDRFYEGYGDNYAPLGNRFDGVAPVARLEAEPVGRLGPTILDWDQSPFSLGFGGSYFYSVGGARQVHSFAGDALLHVSGFSLLAELLWATSLPEEQPTRTTNQIEKITSYGFVAEAGYAILKRKLALAARFEWIDANTAVEDEADNWLVTGGLSYWFVETLLRVQADYTHREELYGLPLANELVNLQAQAHF